MKHFEDLLTFTDPVFLAHLNIVTFFKGVVMLGCFFSYDIVTNMKLCETYFSEQSDLSCL